MPCIQASSISTIFWVPMRQGTHLPQDSLRKKRTELKAMSNMQARLVQTTTAPEPTMEPNLDSVAQSSGVSSMDAGRYPDEGPEGAKPTTSSPGGGPPARSKISSR